VLSNGEQFLARCSANQAQMPTIQFGNIVVFDEFTSVVDRNVPGNICGDSKEHIVADRFGLLSSHVTMTLRSGLSRIG
jgi:hypothetical protein